MHPLTSIAWPYRWLWTHWVRVFFEVIRWQVVTFQIIAGSSFFSKCMWTKSCSWAALLKFWFQTAWPRIQKFNRLLHAGKAIAFDFFHYNHAVVTFYLQFLCSDWSNLTGEFMRKIYAASWNLFTLTAEADRVLCQLVMFLTVFFFWMYKMKYSCYQDSSVIHGWIVYCAFGWEMHRMSQSLEIRFRMPSFSKLSLLSLLEV